MITKIKDHAVKHGCVMQGIDDLMQGEKADIFYSDPPWGQGNLKYWQTMNNKMTGASKSDIELTEFIAQIFNIANEYSKEWIFIEYGVKWKDQIQSYGKKMGFNSIDIIELQYRSGNRLLPLHLHIFSKKNSVLPVGYAEKVSGTHGFNSLKQALLPLAKEGGLVLDPCCGMGYTARLALLSGMRFRGNELNAKRLQKTIDKLSK